MRPALLRADDAPAPAWRNGGGTTRELLTRPARAGWRVRVSATAIDRDGPLATLVGVERRFVVLEGAGPRPAAATDRRVSATPEGVDS